MPTAILVGVWKDGTYAYATARVNEGPDVGQVEYGPVMVPAAYPDGTQRSNVDLKEALRLALKAARDRQMTVTQPVPLTGTITI